MRLPAVESGGVTGRSSGPEAQVAGEVGSILTIQTLQFCF